MIRGLLENKNSKEKLNIKSLEISKFNHKGKFKKGDIDFEIISLEPIVGGVQIFARAWKDGIPLGFGSDGSVEIERFRIFNPPILVDDENGDIIKAYIDPTNGQKRLRLLKEDPQRAIQEIILEAIKSIGKESETIIIGKTGKTTDIWYPEAGQGTYTFDGVCQSDWLSWSTSHDASSSLNAWVDQTFSWAACVGRDALTQFSIARGMFLFRYSIPSGSTNISAKISLNGYCSNATNDGKNYVRLVSSNPGSNTNISTNDYNDLGSTGWANDYDLDNMVTEQYYDFDFNATGLSQLTADGTYKILKAGFRTGHDLENSPPANQTYTGFGAYFADYAGTTKDPKLTISYTTPSQSQAAFLLRMI